MSVENILHLQKLKIKILKKFSNTLEKLGFDHQLLSRNEVSDRLGTKFYNIALYTKGGILLNPGKLARAMINALPVM